MNAKQWIASFLTGMFFCSGAVNGSTTDRSRFFLGFGLEGMRHSLLAGNGHEVIGNSLHTKLNGFYLSQSWFVSTDISMIVGPHEPIRSDQLAVDFQGAGGSLLWGYSAQDIDLRHRDGGYGFSLGLLYWDTVGRQIGENQRREGWSRDLRNRGKISHYQMRMNTLALMPGIFFAWLQPERLQGKTPKELQTRIEGYFLNIGLAFPISSSYRAGSTHYVLHPYRNFSPGSSIEAGDLIETETSSRGNMSGFSIMVSWTALFGV